MQAGTFDTARTLITTASDGPLDESQRARIDLLRAQLAFASSRGTEATSLLLAAAQRLEPLDISLARETYLDAFSAACSEPGSMTPLAYPRLHGPLVRCRADARMSPRLPTCC